MHSGLEDDFEGLRKRVETVTEKVHRLGAAKSHALFNTVLASVAAIAAVFGVYAWWGERETRELGVEAAKASAIATYLVRLEAVRGTNTDATPTVDALFNLGVRPEEISFEHLYLSKLDLRLAPRPASGMGRVPLTNTRVADVVFRPVGERAYFLDSNRASIGRLTGGAIIYLSGELSVRSCSFSRDHLEFIGISSNSRALIRNCSADEGVFRLEGAEIMIESSAFRETSFHADTASSLILDTSLITDSRFTEGYPDSTLVSRVIDTPSELRHLRRSPFSCFTNENFEVCDNRLRRRIEWTVMEGGDSEAVIDSAILELVNPYDPCGTPHIVNELLGQRPEFRSIFLPSLHGDGCLGPKRGTPTEL